MKQIRKSLKYGLGAHLVAANNLSDEYPQFELKALTDVPLSKRRWPLSMKSLQDDIDYKR